MSIAEDYDDFEDLPEPCPVCDGDGMELGALGWTMHYRCRQCGMQWSKKIER